MCQRTIVVLHIQTCSVDHQSELVSVEEEEEEEEPTYQSEQMLQKKSADANKVIRQRCRLTVFV